MATSPGLIRAGFKVAICDQMEQPGPGKKIVRREVVRVITPGTATDVAVLDAKENNFLAAVYQDRAAGAIGLAYVDLSTGEFQSTEFSGPRAEDAVRDELQLLHPRETLLPRPAQLFETSKNSFLDGTGGVESRIDDWAFQHDYAHRILREQFGVAELTAFGLDGHLQALGASGAIVHYLRENAATAHDADGNGKRRPESSLEALQHLDRVRYYQQHDALVLDRFPSAISSSSLPSSMTTPAKTRPPLWSRLSTSRSPGWARGWFAPGSSVRSSTARPSKPASTPWPISSSKPWCAAKSAKSCARSRISSA
jgi:DNA mismatch repair protein MutS